MALTVTAPWAAAAVVDSANDSAAPASGSLAAMVPVKAVSSSVVSAVVVIRGTSSTAATFKLTVAGSETAPSLSVAVKVKLSAPLTSASGTNTTLPPAWATTSPAAMAVPLEATPSVV